MSHIILYIHKYDFICISETYSDSSVQLDDDELRINGYKLILTDHLLNTKRGGVWTYYKESLVVKMTNISFLQECLLREVMIDNIRRYIALMYKSPRQNSSIFPHFLPGFEQLLINIEGFKPNFKVLPVLGDYNACSKSSWLLTPAHLKVSNLMP